MRAGGWRRLVLEGVVGVALPVALARVPRVVALLPSLGVLRGPAALVLAAVAASLGVCRVLDALRPGWSATLARTPPWLLLVLTAGLYAGVGLYYASRLAVSGDEPHYLVMAQSLWRDHDLELRNDYGGLERLEYAPGPLQPHWGAPRADGRPYPAHSPGLPALIAPAYAALGRAGAVLLVALLAAAAALVCQRLVLGVTGDEAASRSAWLAAAGPPLFFYSFHIYTEAPSALASGGSLALLLGAPGVAGVAVAALGAAALPWLHVKMVPAAAALGVVALARLRGRPLVAFLAVSGAAAASFLGYYASVLGRASPLALYGGLPDDARVLTWRALPGLLLDRSFGLLPVAPVFLLALAGLPLLVRRRGAWPHFLVGLATLGPLLSWRMWWGGQCPPARFLVPLLPLLAVALGLRLARSTTGLARWWRGLLLAGGALAAVAVADPASHLLLNRANRPTRLWTALSGPPSIGDYLPSLTHDSSRDARIALVWLVALAGLLVLDVLAQTRPRLDRAFSSLAVAVAAALLLGMAVDLTAGPVAAAPPAETAPAAP